MGTVLATVAVETQGKGSALATKAVKTTDPSDVISARPQLERNDEAAEHHPALRNARCELDQLCVLAVAAAAAALALLLLLRRLSVGVRLPTALPGRLRAPGGISAALLKQLLGSGAPPGSGDTPACQRTC